jgi:hypothetical protein
MKYLAMESKTPQTLQLKWPAGATLALAFVCLIALAAMLEVLARQNFVQEHLPAPGLGSAHRQFEIQLANLRERVARDGPVDCIILGSSQTLRAIDPADVETAFRKKTGQSIRCQNFGVRGASTQTAAMLAKILFDEFDPQLLIYGTSFIDFSGFRGVDAQESILISPWIQHRSIAPNFEGWLIDWSAAYREYLGLQATWFPVVTVLTKNNPTSELNILPNGFNPMLDTTVRQATLLTAAGEEQDMRAAFSKLNLPALNDILSLHDPGRHTIVVLEMPVNPRIFSDHPEFIEYKQIYQNLLIEKGREHHVAVWSSDETLPQLTDAHWFDYVHLNIDGAKIFSVWLGNRIGDAILNREIILNESK